MIRVYLTESILNVLIEYVYCITDPLLALIRRAENILIDTQSNEILCEVYSDELERLADIQHYYDRENNLLIVGEQDIILLLKCFSSN